MELIICAVSAVALAITVFAGIIRLLSRLQDENSRLKIEIKEQKRRIEFLEGACIIYESERIKKETMYEKA